MFGKKKSKHQDHKFCPVCGTTLKLEDTFCIKCGYSFKERAEKNKKAKKCLDSNGFNNSSLLWSEVCRWTDMDTNILGRCLKDHSPS